MARTNRTMYAVLGFLTWCPMSGYDIKKRVEESTSNFWQESYGQIYPILQRLVDQGLARREAASGEGEKRERQVYSITEAGRAELRRWLAEPTVAQNPRNEFLLKIFFGEETDAATCRKQIGDLRAFNVAELQRYEEMDRDLREAYAGMEGLPFWLLTLRYGVIEREAQIRWCDEALEALAADGRGG